ncbi:DUF523 domain-containing protein [Paenibacillus puldeungensis]|uniref:DUF523 domain-containing protein n=1 Tax=Paenibacillus puldeungensis TaxID=696536 RepID=A0ABW3RUE1_9BACL
MYLVSSYLAGLKVRYNGTDCLQDAIARLVQDHKAITVCPELLGGFATPREPAEIIGGVGEDVLEGKAKVIDKSGQDVTELYVKGAYETLRTAREVGAVKVVLKEFSPSCGTTMIYNGTFSGEKIAGNGVTAALLRREGFKVMSEHQFLDEILDTGE